MKIAGWILLVAIVLVLLFLALKPKKKQSACGKAISGSTVAGSKISDDTAESICNTAQDVLNATVGEGSIADDLNHAITGVGIGTFKTFGETSDFDRLKRNMHSAYVAGNNAAAVAVQQQAPGMINCQPKGGNGGHIDCDDNPRDLGNGTVEYHTSDGKVHQVKYGPKVPIGGCAVWPTLSDGYSNAAAVKDNALSGDCGFWASVVNTIGGTKKAA